MISKCFLCDANKGEFDTDHRVCTCNGLQEFPQSEHPLYATILPEPGEYDIGRLPSIHATKFLDLYAMSAQAFTRGSAIPTTALERNARSSSPPREKELPAGPMPLHSPNHLYEKFGLTCGNPILYRVERLENWSGFSELYVLDMSTYLWSGTLKDPRSWAIINTALDYGITELSLWTAGNAGISLAKIAYAVNRSLPADKRLHIYGIVDMTVQDEVRSRLRTWQCDVLEMPSKTKPVLDPEEIRARVKDQMMTRNQSMNPSKYWHVTDGWDGVGLLMYRYLGAQVIRDVKPKYLVAPVGTGDLLLGFYQGLLDCERNSEIEKDACTLVGVVPIGENILQNIRNQRINTKDPERRRVIGKNDPVMPKLIGRYSPLAPCIHRLDMLRKVRFVEVDGDEQVAAGHQVLKGGLDLGIACEPSALSAFAGLSYVNDIARELEGGGPTSRLYKSPSRVVVINSGSGVMGKKEFELLNMLM